MRTFKKLLVSFFSAAILTSVIPVGIMTADGSDIYTVSSEDERFSYCEDSDGIKIKASEGVKFTDTLNLPATLDGKSVTAIADRGFMGQQELKSVELPETVVKIGNNAFSNCYSLSKANIKGIITDIGAYPFFASPFEKTLVKKGDFVLLNKDILYDYTGTSQNIQIPRGVRVISGNLFTHAEDVRGFEIDYVSVPDSVEYICNGAFYNCNSISEINLGSGLKYIGENAFTASKATVSGYYDTCAQQFAADNDLKFEPLIEYGKQSENIYADFSDDFRQYYYSDEKEFSREGVFVYRRNYNGEKIEVTDWDYSSELSELISGDTAQ